MELFMKEISFKSYDDKRLACFLWDDVENPKGVIQLIHGLTSHTMRYEDFAKTLNNNGYIVFGDDHRMNGQTAGLKNLGKAGKNNFNENVQDELAITKMLKEKYGLPVQLFAHSYGSFLAQRYIELGGNLIDGVLLSGSAYMGGNMLFLGKVLTFFQRIFLGTFTPGKMFYKMTFTSNDKYFLQDNIKNAWLNRDFEKVKIYNADPLCDFVMSNGFFYALMRGLSDANKPENLKKIRKNLPITLMSGEKDPVGGMGQKVIALNELYKSLGLSVTMKLYKDVRHELTADFDEVAIVGNMINFFDGNLKKS
jgi:alpha-beta hydrolase superfamily lysophospholipase